MLLEVAYIMDEQPCIVTRLTAECRACKATINLQLTLGDQPPPPPRACQVRPQP